MVEIAISKFLLSDPSNILKITPIGQKCYILGLIFLFKKKNLKCGVKNSLELSFVRAFKKIKV